MRHLLLFIRFYLLSLLLLLLLPTIIWLSFNVLIIEFLHAQCRKLSSESLIAF